MNQQDKSFLITFTTVMAVLVVIAAAIFLASRMVAMISVHTEDDARRAAAIEERIKPIASVAVADPSKKEAAPAKMSGDAVYNNVCASCHGAGVLNAPRFGSKDDWEPRAGQGLDTLVNNAVNGIRAMPAKGGNPNLSEEEIKEAIVYMLGESGIDIAAASGEAPATAEAPAAGGAAGIDLAKGKETYGGACFACHDTGAAGAPKKGDKDAWAPRAEQGLDTLVSHAVNGFRAMPAKGGNPNLSENDIRNAIAFILSETGIEVAAAAPTAAEAPAAAEKAAPEAAPQPAASSDQMLAAVQEATAAAQQAAEAARQATDAVQKLLAAQAGSAVEVSAPKEAPATEEKAQPAAETTAPESAPAEQEPAAEAPEAAPPAEQPQAAAPETPAIELPDSVDLARGKQLYDSACVICHEAGVAGAPKLGDEQAWAPRIAQGFDLLVEHAINGFKGMPPKGGRMDLPDAEIINAIGYMVSQTK